MTDPLQSAREALAEIDADAHLYKTYRCKAEADHLRTALAEVDRLSTHIAELERLQQSIVKAQADGYRAGVEASVRQLRLMADAADTDGVAVVLRCAAEAMVEAIP